MIFDKIENARKYYANHPLFEKGFDFIKKALAEDLPVGKYEIEGKDLYASIQEYTSKVAPEGKFEGHRNYIDIQYIISGIEVMENVDIKKAELKSEYNDVKDVEFYHDNIKAGKLVAESGEYAIFFPNDIHKPGMTYGETPSTVKKIVVKVKI